MACHLVSARFLNCWNCEPMLEYVNWTPRNKLRLKFNRNSCIFIDLNPLNMSPGKWRSCCLGLSVLKHIINLWMGRIPCWLLDSHWRYYPLYELNIFRKHEYICLMYIYLYFLSFHPYWVGAGSQHSYQCRTRTCLSYRTNIMATDVLETQVAKSSSTVVLTKFSSVIPASSAKGLKSDNLIDFWASYDDQAIHIWYIVADAKWPPFRRWHFQKHFFNVSIRISVKKSLRYIPRVQLTITHHWFR